MSLAEEWRGSGFGLPEEEAELGMCFDGVGVEEH